jgi:hypothetical protein
MISIHLRDVLTTGRIELLGTRQRGITFGCQALSSGPSPPPGNAIRTQPQAISAQDSVCAL